MHPANQCVIYQQRVYMAARMQPGHGLDYVCLLNLDLDLGIESLTQRPSIPESHFSP